MLQMTNELLNINDLNYFTFTTMKSIHSGKSRVIMLRYMFKVKKFLIMFLAVQKFSKKEC